MDLFTDEQRQFLTVLINNKVSFMLIGGYAVIHYGYERLTTDMDIWLKPDNANRDCFINALKEFDIEESGIEHLSSMDFTDAQVFFFGKTPRRIDFLTKVSGIDFDEAIGQVNFFLFPDIKVPVIHYNHLIRTKMNTGRLKDKADIEELEKINKYRKK